MAINFNGTLYNESSDGDLVESGVLPATINFGVGTKISGSSNFSDIDAFRIDVAQTGGGASHSRAAAPGQTLELQFNSPKASYLLLHVWDPISNQIYHFPSPNFTTKAYAVTASFVVPDVDYLIVSVHSFITDSTFTNYTAASYTLNIVGKAAPSGLFDASSNTVNFNNPTDAQSTHLAAGKARYDAQAGDDVVTLPNKATSVPGGWNSNTIFSGGLGNDLIQGGNRADNIRGAQGNDVIKGGADIDVAHYTGAFADYRFSKIDGGIGVRDSRATSPDGKDSLSAVEYLQFSDRKVAVSDLFPTYKFVLVRDGKDGHSELTFYRNGEEKARTSLSGTNDPLNLANDCAYDDATPIPTGTYEVMYRLNGGVSKKCWEFMNEDAVSTVKGRSAIQLHGGNITQDSEGCIVASPSSFLNKVTTIVDKDMTQFSDNLVTKNGKQYYALPDTFTFQVNGDIPQPKVALGANLGLDEGSTKALNFGFEKAGADNVISKVLCVTMKVDDADAKYGVDWTFAGKAKTWNEGKGQFDNVDISSLYDKASKTLEFWIPSMEKAPAINIRAVNDGATEANEAVGFKIVDVDIFSWNKPAAGEIRKYKGSSLDAVSPVDQLLFTKGDTTTVTIKGTSAGAPSHVIDDFGVASAPPDYWIIGY